MMEILRQFGLNLWEWAPLVMPLTLAVYALGWWFLCKRKPEWRRRLRHLPPVGAAILFIIASYAWRYYHRPLPAAVDRELFPGVRYIRETRAEPRALVVHVVIVGLRTPGLEFLVTPGDSSGGREMIARTTSEFLQEFEMDLAINGGFFHPWISNEPFYYYPKSGDPIDVKGAAMSRGAKYSEAEKHFSPVSISRSNEVAIGHITADAFNIISGGKILLTNGVPLKVETESLHPRTAVALNKERDQLFLIVVDGRQPNYSEGVTLRELAEIASRFGADNAVNMDGGGSSALVMRGGDGKPSILNSPIRGRIPPGMERPSGNHLGLRVRRPVFVENSRPMDAPSR